MTNPSNKKRVVTDDDIQVLDAHIAYAKTQADRAAGVVEEFDRATQEFAGVLQELADSKADLEQSQAALANVTDMKLRDNLAAITGADGFYRAADTGYAYQRSGGVNTRRPALDTVTQTALAATDATATQGKATADASKAAINRQTFAALAGVSKDAGTQYLYGSQWVPVTTASATLDYSNVTAAVTAGLIAPALESGWYWKRVYYGTAQTGFANTPKSPIGGSDTDAAPKLQALLDSIPSFGELQIPEGRYILYSQLVNQRGVSIVGAGIERTQLVFVGCSGISSGGNGGRISGLSLKAAIRHSSTANVYTGLSFIGSAATNINNWTITDVYVDGFRNGMIGNFIWNFNIRNLSTGYGLIGIDIYGKSVNNHMFGGRLGVQTGLAGSRGIRMQSRAFNGRNVASEGWTFTSVLTAYAERAVELLGVSHNKFIGCMFDFCEEHGVYMADQPAQAAVGVVGDADYLPAEPSYQAMNNEFVVPYIAMSKNGAIAAWRDANADVNAQMTGNQLLGGKLLTYGTTCTYGVMANTPGALYTVVAGTSMRGFSIKDALGRFTNKQVLVGTPLLSATANGNVTGFDFAQPSAGTVYRENFKSQHKIGAMTIIYGEGVPPTNAAPWPCISYDPVPVELGTAGSKYTIPSYTMKPDGTWIAHRALSGN